MDNEKFYAECAALLGCEHEGSPFAYYKRTRWNNRKAGQGRFLGRGIIRAFGDNLVQVRLHDPILSMDGTKQEVLEALTKLKPS